MTDEREVAKHITKTIEDVNAIVAGGGTLFIYDPGERLPSSGGSPLPTLATKSDRRR